MPLQIFQSNKKNSYRFVKSSISKNARQVNQNGSRLRPDFRVTIGGKELKSAQGLYFDDNPRSQSQASHRIASGVTVWCLLWLAT